MMRFTDVYQFLKPSRDRVPLGARRATRDEGVLQGRAALTLLLLLVAFTTTLSAQTDQRLRDAVRLAQEGSSDSARTVVGALLQNTAPTDSLYPQVLFTMGLVSRNVEDMRRTYTRVAVEYNNSPWADDAIYRLGLLDYAAGNVTNAIRQMDRLRNDYPGSPLIGPASEWAARALFDQKKIREGCGWLASGMEQSGEDIELRNRLEFLNGRCTSQAMADTSPAPATPASPAPAPAPPRHQPRPRPRSAGMASRLERSIRRRRPTS